MGARQKSRYYVVSTMAFARRGAKGPVVKVRHNAVIDRLFGNTVEVHQARKGALQLARSLNLAAIGGDSHE